MSPKGKITKPLDVYVRVSRVGGREGDSFISPAVQEERCRALATARDYRVGEVLTDLDKSGGTMDRPALNLALDRIRQGVSGGIIVARIDRFARTMQGALNAIEEIEEAGGFLIECDGDWDTSTSMGRFGRDLVLRISQLFREQATEGWATARSGAIERGIHGGSRVPVGYRRDEETRQLVADPKTAPHVAEIFRMRMRGASWSEISDYLHAHKIVTSAGGRVGGGKRWSDTSLRKLIGNRVYLGEARSGSFTKPDAHEAIVPEEIFRAANRVKGAAPVRRGESEGFLLQKVLLCAGCGRRLTGDYTMSGGKRYEFYRCKQSPGCPAPATISATLVEPWVVEKFTLPMLSTAMQSAELVEGATEAPDAIVQAVRKAEEELQDVLAARDGFRSPLAFGQALDAAHAALERAQEARADLATAVAVSSEAQAWLASWQAGDEATIRETWAKISTRQRRETIYAMLKLADLRGFAIKRGRGPIEERLVPDVIEGSDLWTMALERMALVESVESGSRPWESLSRLEPEVMRQARA